MVSSPTGSINSPLNSPTESRGGKRSQRQSKKKKSKAVKVVIPPEGLQVATVMDENEIEDHAEAMEMIESPHKVLLSISCKDLPDMDVGVGTSDPFAIVYVKGEKEKKWQRVGQTETIEDNVNPKFAKEFQVNYLFERN